MHVWNVGLLVGAVVLITMILAAASQPRQQTSTTGATVTKPGTQTTTVATRLESKVVPFPFSWIETGHGIDIEITVVNVTYLGTGTLERIGLGGVKAEKGYQFYGVYVTFRNLGHEQFYSYQSGVGASLELQTNRSNLYGPE
jgi:hypothetical protein